MENLNSLGQVNYYAGFYFKLLSDIISCCEKDEEIIIVDVGFNVGQFSKMTEMFFERYFPALRYKIIAFEPNVYFTKYAPKIKNLMLNNFALSSKEGDLVLNIPCFPGEPTDIEHGVLSSKRSSDGGIYGTSTLSDERKLQLLQERPDINFVELKTSVKTLDDFLESLKIDKIHWIKIDVESYEKEVFTGSKKYLESGKILGGQFEGDTKLGSNYWSSGKGLGNDENTQNIMDSGNLSIISTNGSCVKLPSNKPLFNGEFFFLNNQIIEKVGKYKK